MLHEERMPHFFDDSPVIPDNLAAEWVLRFLLDGFSAPPTPNP
jgi:hypothetical protein